MSQEEERTILVKISSVLASLYPMEADARRIAAEASLYDRYINFAGNATNCWYAVLEEARKSQLVHNVLDIAQAQYPRNQALHTICEEYRHWYKADRQNSGVASSPYITTVYKCLYRFNFHHW